MPDFSPERWRVLHGHLDDLLDRGPEDRAARLAEVRRGDPALAADLETLLEEHLVVEREAFLDGPANLSTQAVPGIRPMPGGPALSGKTGQELGPYTLIEPLGAGGMGEVWLAEQREPVRRQVAIKVIRRGMDTEQVVARFEAERQALALMDHTAVARVFDAGSTPEGRPYFVMEHVRGIAITEHCDRERLGVRARLELFRLVCDGVRHAHQKAVLHRDLKPKNVLVTLQDGKPIPKIIDFGVAKATAQRLTEHTLDTAAGALVGTPEYMSPEQADVPRQDIDTRTDVYSLGVILYELLAGALPFDPAAFREGGYDAMRRRIREEEPKRPSARLAALDARTAASIAAHRGTDAATLLRLVKGDLDWIVMKALEKDRGRRYGAAADLAADVGRHLGHLPVLAGPPTFRYRAGKFVRRHRMGVGVAAVGLVAAIVFGAAMGVQMRRTERERDRANREAATANRALDFLTTLFEVSNPSETRGNTVTAREILDRGAMRIDADLKDEPLIQARLLMTLGKVYGSLGLEKAAQPLLEKSVALRRSLLGEDAPDTLDSLDALATNRQDQGQLAEAETGFRAVLAGRRRTIGEGAANTLVSANNLGLILKNEGKLQEAETYLRQALDGERRIFPPDDPEILTTMNNYGLVLEQEGRFADAEPYARQVLDACRRTIGNDHPHTLSAVNNLALDLDAEGKRAEAEPLWREAYETRRRVLGPDHPLSLLSTLNYGYALRNAGKVAESEPYSREALDGCRRVLGPDHPRTLAALNGIGSLQAIQGKWKEAETSHRACLLARRRTLGDDHNDTLDSMQALAAVLLEEGSFREAEALLKEALERGGRSLGASHPLTLGARAALADLRTREGHPDEARPRLEEILEAERRALPAGSRLIGRTLDSYGRCLIALDRFPEAEAALDEARSILEKAEPVALPKVARDLSELHARRHS